MKLLITAVVSVCLILGLASCQSTECRIERWKCNDKCGDGTLGKLCQDACSLEYNFCLKEGEKKAE